MIKRYFLVLATACMASVIFAETNAVRQATAASAISNESNHSSLLHSRNPRHERAEAEFRARVALQNAREHYAFWLSAKERAAELPVRARAKYNSRLNSAWKNLVKTDAAYRDARAKVSQEELDAAQDYLKDDEEYERFMDTIYLDPSAKSNLVEKIICLVEDERVRIAEASAKAAIETPRLLAQWQAAIEAYKEKHDGNLPRSLATLKESTSGSEGLMLTDGWGNDLVFVLNSSGAYKLISCGPDGKPTTADDISVGDLTVEMSGLRSRRKELIARREAAIANRNTETDANSDATGQKDSSEQRK